MEPKNEKTVSDAVHYRRSVRVFTDEPLDTSLVKQCVQEAVLAPNSSNMQLWQFCHVTGKDTLQQLATACFGQPAARTAQQMVVVVVRKDLWRQRTKANIRFLENSFGNKKPSELQGKEKFAINYYRKIMPTIYFDVLGILGLLKYAVFKIAGLFKPVYKQVRLSDMRIVAHKSAALAAQTFMLAMAAKGYDTCPMEGSDTDRAKKILNLPWRAEINMIIACGLRDEKGIYGPRFRVPFEEVYKRI